jgi:hypothetical protein
MWVPGFGGFLDEDTRWALVDFLHANADRTDYRSAR